MDKVSNPNAEWKEELSPLAYKGDARARHRSGPAATEDFPKEPGTYRCVCWVRRFSTRRRSSRCCTRLPFIYEPLEKRRESWEKGRTVALSCGHRGLTAILRGASRTCLSRWTAAHGPLRYCINGVALTFEPEDG